jgi:hypothetical protein
MRQVPPSYGANRNTVSMQGTHTYKCRGYENNSLSLGPANVTQNSAVEDSSVNFTSCPPILLQEHTTASSIIACFTTKRAHAHARSHGEYNSYSFITSRSCRLLFGVAMALMVGIFVSKGEGRRGGGGEGGAGFILY